MTNANILKFVFHTVIVSMPIAFHFRPILLLYSPLRYPQTDRRPPGRHQGEPSVYPY